MYAQIFGFLVVVFFLLGLVIVNGMIQSKKFDECIEKNSVNYCKFYSQLDTEYVWEEY